MKTFIIALAVIVGGIQFGSKAFDVAQESAQQSQTAQLIQERHEAL